LKQLATSARQTIGPARKKRAADAAGEADTPDSDKPGIPMTTETGEPGDPEHLHCQLRRQPSDAALAASLTGPATPAPVPA
jgi:hypothetical protein